MVDPLHSSNASGLMELSQCQKVFVDVMAVSPDQSGAVVCCSWDETKDPWSSDALFGICPHVSPGGMNAGQLPFLGRLTKFPDALVIPLFPLLIRIGFRTYQTVVENGYLVLDTTFGVHSFRRLVFYFFLMQFRGWILYVALNRIEDNFFEGKPINETKGHNNKDETTCWYSDWLQETQPYCHGRRFDFSDHVVLYFAQLLPIALLEYLHSLNQPYWPYHVYRRYSVPLLLTVGILYLYFITFVGLFKTAAYFHTPRECLAGFAVSLFAQLPLCFLQCCNRFESLRKLREFFFGRKTKT